MKAESNSRLEHIAYLNEKSECLRCLGHYRKAIAQAQRALKSAKKSPSDPQGQGNALNSLGCTYRQRGELDRAEKILIRSFAIGEKLNNPQQIATSLINLGKLYRQRGELDRAEDCCQRVLALKSRINSPHHIANCLNNLGEVYWLRGKLDFAKKYFQQSLALREEIGNRQEIAESRYQLIRIGLMSGSPAVAIGQIDQLAQIAQLSELADIAVRFHLAAGQLKLQQGDLRDALTHGWQARSQAEQIPHFGLTIEASKFLMEALLQLFLFGEQEEHLTWCAALLQRLEELAKRERLYGIYAESLLMQGLLKRATFDLQSASEMFERAELLAAEQGLSIAAQHARDELAKLRKQIIKLRQSQRISPEVYEQLQVQEVLGYLQQVRTAVG